MAAITPTASTLPAATAVDFGEVDFIGSEITAEGRAGERIKHGIGGHVIFIITWFETSRKWVEYYYLPGDVTYKLAMSYTVHSIMVSTIIVGVVVIFGSGAGYTT